MTQNKLTCKSKNPSYLPKCSSVWVQLIQFSKICSSDSDTKSAITVRPSGTLSNINEDVFCGTEKNPYT